MRFIDELNAIARGERVLPEREPDPLGCREYLAWVMRTPLIVELPERFPALSRQYGVDAACVALDLMLFALFAPAVPQA